MPNIEQLLQRGMILLYLLKINENEKKNNRIAKSALNSNKQIL